MPTLHGVKSLLTKLERVELRSQQDGNTVFNNLGHIVDIEMLVDCFKSLDGTKAAGVDGVSKETYGRNLIKNLEELLFKIRRGSYHPKPSRIKEIPKSDGSNRPLAIACFDDKIVQEAVKRILDVIYEPLFLDCSHGFRRGKGCDTALVDLNKHLMSYECGAVLDIDLRKYFNTIPHKPLEALLRQKISDEKFLRLILKLMNAPILDEAGNAKQNTVGVPQGSIVSPVLSNLYLHATIDLWFKEVNGARFGGNAQMVRYADDAIFVFRNESEAIRFQILLNARLGEYGIALNLDKTKIVGCGSKEAERCKKEGISMPSFTFLGFLHVWGKSVNRKTGTVFWRVKRRTCPRRFRKKVTEIKEYISKHRHDTGLIPRIIMVVRGYINYFGINDNGRRIFQFLAETRKALFKYLNKRSQRRSFTWPKFLEFLNKNAFPNRVKLKNLFFNLRPAR